jgi:hypothetical protein
MKNTIINAAIIILFIGAAAAGAWFTVHFFSKSSPSSTQSVQLPMSGTASSTGTEPSQSKTTVTTSSGDVIQTNNFLASPATGAYPSPGYYYLGYHTPIPDVTDTTATSHPPYVIEYIASTQYFNISLLQEPIGEARKQAEQYLMAMLGISQAQMCQLQYMVSVPWTVNAEYSGENLGFSFCADAVTLPQ